MDKLLPYFHVFELYRLAFDLILTIPLSWNYVYIS